MSFFGPHGEDSRRGKEDKKGHPRLMTPHGVGGFGSAGIAC